MIAGNRIPSMCETMIHSTMLTRSQFGNAPKIKGKWVLHAWPTVRQTSARLAWSPNMTDTKCASCVLEPDFGV
ncbi:hypothetical protein BD311DRAFT_767787 [Dichomitus squalens]|uniref:Uncharacterized protein n=1 Tax=Dichomitus squalens TaxID=114155 RepID=A0A4Q9MBU3_9APHY|nr:hypothetical protein BD311DRAFT_767787 [Dichomitus squalens]